MEFKALDGKSVEIDVNGQKYLRHAVQTHYIELGENYIDIIKKYVSPIYEEGDIISISEKIISLCQKRVVYKKDMKVSSLAKFLSKFAMRSDAGVGCYYLLQGIFPTQGSNQCLLHCRGILYC